MTRWTLTVLTVLLLALIPVNGRWIAGWISPSSAQGRQFSLWLASGGVTFQYRSADSWQPTGFHTSERRRQGLLPGYHLAWLPSYKTYSAAKMRSLFCPLWIPALLTMAASAALWRRHAARGRASRNECLACGYDLSGLDAAAPCPECGNERGDTGPIAVSPR